MLGELDPSRQGSDSKGHMSEPRSSLPPPPTYDQLGVQPPAPYTAHPVLSYQAVPPPGAANVTHQVEDIELSEPAASNSNHTSARLPTKMPDKGPLLCIGVIVGIIALVIVIVLPLSFAPLEYYQFGFKRRSTTGSVDTSKVYGPGGRHAVGPDHEFKVFEADAHFEQFKDITVFAADRLQVTISCGLQYYLRKSQLHLLHHNYDIHYKPVLRNNALDALKGAATAYSTREYIHSRQQVEETLFAAVRQRLGGSCCEENCGMEDYQPCVHGCAPSQSCNEANMGLFAEVRYFQLLELQIPEELNGRFLQALVLLEQTETEKLLQQATLIRKTTDKMAEQTINSAREISQNATAQSALIAARAEANAEAALEHARSDGLKHLYDEIGITDPAQRASFDYLRTIRSQDHLRLNVDFQQVIAGPLN